MDADCLESLSKRGGWVGARGGGGRVVNVECLVFLWFNFRGENMLKKVVGVWERENIGVGCTIVLLLEIYAAVRRQFCAGAQLGC